MLPTQDEFPTPFAWFPRSPSPTVPARWPPCAAPPGADGCRCAGQGAGRRYRHGLVKEGEKFAVLTDILGDEDHLGRHGLQVAGTDKGVTALQMDIKINGPSPKIVEIALGQALKIA